MLAGLGLARFPADQSWGRKQGGCQKLDPVPRSNQYIEKAGRSVVSCFVLPFDRVGFWQCPAMPSRSQDT